MAGTAKLTVEIVGDNKFTPTAKHVGKDLDDMDGKFGSVGSSVSGHITGMTSKLGTVAGVVAGAFAVDAVIGFGSEMFNLGQKLDVFDRKVSTVFEGSQGEVRKWADKNNEAFGMSNEELGGLAANFGDLLKPMGFTAAQASTMATDVVGLSGALSAWSGGTKSASEVSDVLAKAMLGERDGLKELGISISEADVTGRLATKGQQDLTGAALEQAKAVATQELIFEKSGDAQKAWADGSMDAVKKTNGFKAALGDLKANLGEIATGLFAGDMASVGVSIGKMFGLEEDSATTGKIIEVLEKIKGAFSSAVGFIKDKVLPLIGPAFSAAMSMVSAAWDAYGRPLFDLIGSVFDGIAKFWDQNGPALTAKFKTMFDSIAGVVKEVWAIIGEVLGVIKAAWAQWGDEIMALVGNAFNTISSVISGVMDVIKGIIDVVMGIIHGDWGRAWDGIKGIVTGVWDAITGVVSGAFNQVKIILGGLFDWFKDMPGKIIGAIGNLGGLLVGAGADLMRGLWDGIKSVASGALDIGKSIANGVIGFINSGLIGSLNSGLDMVWRNIPFTSGKFPWHLPLIPKFHTGGIFNTGQPEGLAWLRQGEGVFTPAQMAAMGGGGTTITVNVTAGVGDPQAIGAQVVEVLRQYERSNGTGWRAA